ncbi:MAG: sigma-70 family polymerase sigma factor, partial [Gemmataceae bacterium]|nr:sigma-70 family polymerase sigma factor [Gemmataceae bacterium]
MQLSPADLFDQLDDAPDAALVDRFLADRDELAFARLVQRHGSMVLGVCRRVLGDAHAAEDAFQATFLVLVRRAGDADGRRLGPWLYGVAYRTALKARVAAFRRAAREQKAAEQARPRPSDSPPAADVADLAAVLDEELNRLPGQLREAVVLCDLEGLSRRQAARRAGCPESTLSSRLALARDQLARRLTRRGIAPVFAGLAAAVPVSLARATCSTAVAVAAGVVADVPVPISRLSDEVIRTMALPHRIA